VNASDIFKKRRRGNVEKVIGMAGKVEHHTDLVDQLGRGEDRLQYSQGHLRRQGAALLIRGTR